jgi:hypothetical protein
VAAGYLAKRLKLGNEASIRAYLDRGVEAAVDYDMSQAGHLSADGKLTVDAKNAVIKAGADYVLAHVPDAVAHFGLDQATVERKVEAKLGAALGLIALPTGVEPSRPLAAAPAAKAPAAGTEAAKAPGQVRTEK